MDELSYFGGLIDGEGCFTLSQPRKKYKSFTPVFALASTSDVIITFVATILTKHDVKFSICAHDRKDGSKPFKTLRVQSVKNMSKLLDLVLPYLLEKRPQAELLKQFVAVRQQYAKNNMEWKVTDDIVSNIRRLNKRGVA